MRFQLSHRQFLPVLAGLTTFAFHPSSAAAAEPAPRPLVVKRDVFYTAAQDKLQALDLYAPAGAKKQPVVLWIHGGGWKGGDKGSVQKKPQAFTAQGYIFASANYRLLPAATVQDSMADLAKAVRWLHDHAAEFGGDPDSILVLGHSAGAHLAALLCTDHRYLQAEGLSLSLLKGCAPLDVSAYDIPKRLQEGGSAGITASFLSVFGDSSENQRQLSPVTHIAPGKNIPPFLIFHVASRDDTKAQAHWLQSKLQAAGIPARVHAAEGKTHGSIGSDLGLDTDLPTQELWKFLHTSAPAPEAGK